MPVTVPTSDGLNPEDIRIGATVKALREARGFTQDQLANAALLSRPYLANIETGRKRPSMKAIARLAAALTVPQVALIAQPAEALA